MKRLTDKQVEVLRFLENFCALKGFPPTISELAQKFQVKESTMFSHIRTLRRKGYLTHEPGKNRSHRPVLSDSQYMIEFVPGRQGLYLVRHEGTIAEIIARFLGAEEARRLFTDPRSFVLLNSHISDRAKELIFDRK